MYLYDAIIRFMNAYWDSKGTLDFWTWLKYQGIDIKDPATDPTTICVDFEGAKEDYDVLISELIERFPNEPTPSLNEDDILESLNPLRLEDLYHPEETFSKDITD